MCPAQRHEAPSRRPAALLPAALLLAALAGCVAPAGGVRGWRAFKSPNFELQTDVAPERARAIAQDLEWLHAAIQGTLFTSLPPEPRPILVVAFDSPEDFKRYRSRPDADAFIESTAQGQDVIVMPSSWASYQRTLMAHELGHHFAWRVFRRQPAWFSEGLATYMESLAPVIGDATPTVGGVPVHRVWDLRHDLGASEVLGARELTATGYSYAWVLFHFLLNEEPALFDAYTNRLAAGHDPAVAWREVFPGWDPAQPGGGAALDRTVRAYIKSGKFRIGTAPTPVPVALAERVLLVDEVRELRFSLPWLNSGAPFPRAEAQEEIARTLEELPDHVGALWVLGGLEPARYAELGRRASAAHPEDERSWLLVALGAAKEDAAGREQALRRAVEVAPGSPRALCALAAELLDTGRSGEALPLARTATVEAPNNWFAHALLADALADLGRCAQAVTAQERAVAAVGERATETRRQVEGRLAALEKRCQDTPAAPTVPMVPAVPAGASRREPALGRAAASGER